MRIRFAVLLQCVLLLCTQSVSAVNIEMVTVGNPGNAPDMRFNLDLRPEGYGAVNYVYQIGKYEITNAQYAEFLNAMAKSDPIGLYNINMNRPAGSYLERFGTSPNFSCSVAAEYANNPVNYVSLWDVARFCNWMHNGQPTGSWGPGTTEDGAYHDIGNQPLFGRNANAKFFIPTEDEWYKAAYHDKSAGLAASYSTLAFRSNTLLDSSYGTFNQGGGLIEWTETVSGIYRVWRERGADFRSRTLPQTEDWAFGFRIAAAAPVPEPTSILLFSIAAVMLGDSRLRTRRD